MQNKYFSSVNPQALFTQKQTKIKKNIEEDDHLPSQSNQQENNQDQKCLTCVQYAKILQTTIQRCKSLAKSERKLRKIVDRLEEQNNSVVETTDNAVKDFEDHILKLQQQIVDRDSVISKLAEQIQYINNASDDLSQTLAEQKQKIKQMENYHQQQLIQKNTDINDLRAHIIRQISEKAANQRKYKQQSRKWNLQQYKLKQQIISLNQQIGQKQKLIKLLSDSNNELRVQLLQLKSKSQIQDLTWMTEKKPSFISQTSDNRQLKKENQKLKLLNQSLQFQLQFFIKQSEEFQNALFKTKLERDVFKKTIQKHDLQNKNIKRGYGTIHHNYSNQRRAQQNIPGLIRFSKTMQNSVKTSNSNQILEQEDFQHSMD